MGGVTDGKKVEPGFQNKQEEVVSREMRCTWQLLKTSILGWPDP